MKLKFVFVSALIGAMSSLGLNPALSAPKAEISSLVGYIKAQNQTKQMKAAKTHNDVKNVAYQTASAPRSMLQTRKGKSVRGAKNNTYSSLINHYAATYGVSSSLAHAVVRHESNFQPNIRGKAGEIGLMQIKLQTARGMGYSGSAKGLYEPATNIQYGMKYLAMAQKLGGGSTCGTILKYNAGHGAKRMNPTSAKYCSQVKAYMRSL